jgi:hypothetical protein
MKSELEVAPTGHGATWIPANLNGGEWWYWRVRLVDQEWLNSGGERGKAGPWTPSKTFYPYFEEGDPKDMQEYVARQMDTPDPSGVEIVPNLPTLKLSGPDNGIIITEPRPVLEVRADGAIPEGYEYFFAVDTDPMYTSAWIQRSTDEPWLFQALKPYIILTGAVFGLVSYSLLSVLGLPILLIFGFVRSLTTLPHFIVTEIIGALLARYYFWKKYGKKQWLQYAPVLAVGFACGMALMGMAAVAIALIQKSVSVLIF